jgi:hypothetical protein
MEAYAYRIETRYNPKQLQKKLWACSEIKKGFPFSISNFLLLSDFHSPSEN